MYAIEDALRSLGFSGFKKRSSAGFCISIIGVPFFGSLEGVYSDSVMLEGNKMINSSEMTWALAMMICSESNCNLFF